MSAVGLMSVTLPSMDGRTDCEQPQIAQPPIAIVAASACPSWVPRLRMEGDYARDREVSTRAPRVTVSSTAPLASVEVLVPETATRTRRWLHNQVPSTD